MSSCGKFALNFYGFLPFSGTLRDFEGFQLVVISVSFCDLGVELYTLDLGKFLRRRLFQGIFFKMDNGTSFGGRSFIRCFVERVKRLRMFIHSDRVKGLVLLCLKLPGTWKHVPS